MTLSQLDNLPCSYKVFWPDGDEIDSFLEGGEVNLVWGSFHFLAVDQLTIKGGDSHWKLFEYICLDD